MSLGLLTRSGWWEPLLGSGRVLSRDGTTATLGLAPMFYPCASGVPRFAMPDDVVVAGAAVCLPDCPTARLPDCPTARLPEGIACVMPSYRVSATTTAPVAAVWTLLVDGRSWPRWSSGIDELVEDRSSGLDPQGRDGVGAVRAFRSGRTVAGERLTELVENRRMAYEDTFNPALRDYRAVIELEPSVAGGTVITWRGVWRARPGVGWLMPFVLPGIIQRMADDLAGYAAEVG